jgi:hypothetical protein
MTLLRAALAGEKEGQMMKRMYVLALVAMAAALSAPVAAQDGDDDDQGTCLYNGRSYVTGVAVCQAGQILTCVSGEWQTSNRFCNEAGDGAATLEEGVRIRPGAAQLYGQDD